MVAFCLNNMFFYDPNTLTKHALGYGYHYVQRMSLNTKDAEKLAWTIQNQQRENWKKDQL